MRRKKPGHRPIPKDMEPVVAQALLNLMLNGTVDLEYDDELIRYINDQYDRWLEPRTTFMEAPVLDPPPRSADKLGLKGLGH